MRAYDQIDSAGLGTVYVEQKINDSDRRNVDSKTYVFDRRILSENRKILSPENGRLMLRSMMDVDTIVMEMDGRDILVDTLDCIPRSYTVICWGNVKSSLIIPRHINVSGYEAGKDARVTIHNDQVVIVRFTASNQGRLIYWFAEVDGETDHLTRAVKWGNRLLIPDDNGVVTIPYDELMNIIDDKVKKAFEGAALFWNS